MTVNPVMPQWVSFTKGWHSQPYEAISMQRPELSMAGKNIVITGGGTGIGKGAAIAFAQAGAGSIAILGRRLDRLKTSKAAIERATTKGIRVFWPTAVVTTTKWI